MQTIGRARMLRDQGMELLQRDGGMADEIGQGGQAEIDASRAKRSANRFSG